jgi:protein-S-isoprenylcysteine O-methyltransferase Ste14
MNSLSLWRCYLIVFISISFTFRITRLFWAVRKSRQLGRGVTTARPMFWIMTGNYLIFLGFGAWEGLSHQQPHSWLLAGFGLAFYATALWMRELVMRDLGRFFSPDIEIRSDHRVIQEGFYQFVRHPLLVCLILEILGLGLALNAYRSLLLIGGGLYLPVILIRKHLEEKALVRQLGDNYRMYQRSVGALIPRWQTLFGIYRNLGHA